MALPNPGMVFTPFDPLPASDLNDLVENIESLADGTGFDAGAIGTTDIANGAATSEKLGATIGFYATPTGNLPATPADITTYTEVVDYGGDFAGGVFTAPVNGFYAFVYNWRMNDTSLRVEGYIEKNGTEVAHSMSKGGSANNDPTPTNTIFINLAAGDTVNAGGWSEAGASAFQTGSYFCGYLIGTV